MRNRIAWMAAAMLGAAASGAWAQYPTILPDVKADADRKEAEVQQHNDEVWQKVLPIVQEWEKKGKPYVPGASRPTDLQQAEIPAFPGAEGAGMFTAGGRGGRVFVVTSLEDSGPGTFRDACEAGGPRVIVFNVAGIIHLKTKINIRAPYVTIAGNTAPGDGVCIAADSVEIDTHDVVIRHMRFRRGQTWVGDRNDSLGGNPVGNIIVDHVSASWGLDENMSIYRHTYRGQKLSSTNVTIQWSISSEAMDTFHHSFGSTIGGNNNTFHHNLYANNTGRNPSISGGNPFNWINNVTYNWEHRTADGISGGNAMNAINNYYKPGPRTPNNQPIGYRIVKMETANGNRAGFYVEGNIVEGNEKVTKDNWDGGVQVEGGGNPDALRRFRAEKPVDPPTVTIHTAKQAFELVLDHVGATIPRRDAVDTRVIKEVRTGNPTFVAGKGIITDIQQVGGYPEYKGEPYADADKDGLPDAWETKYGLNPKDASDAVADLNGDGYTNIEDFIYGIDPTKKVDWKELKNNVDLLTPISVPMN